MGNAILWLQSAIKKHTDGRPQDERWQSINGAASVSRPIDIPGTWDTQVYDDVTNVLQSKELPAGVIAVKVTYYNIASAVGIAMGIAIGAANASAGEAAIDAGTTPQLPLGNSDSWEFVSSTAITRVDFKTVIAETGTSKFVLEWKVAS